MYFGWSKRTIQSIWKSKNQLWLKKCEENVLKIHKNGGKSSQKVFKNIIFN